jgi:tetratricopeptide (TPR) repeat protein
VLECRLDANQVLDLKLRHTDAKWVEPFAETIENPLTNIVNPNRIAVKIEQMEEEIRAGGNDDDALANRLVELADLNRELRHCERALDLLQRAGRVRGEDLDILNRMGGCAADMHDYVRAEKFYRQSIAAGGGAVVWFNLSILQERQGKLEAARASIREAIAIARVGPYLVQQASLVAKQGDATSKQSILDEAFRLFGDVRQLGDWDLSWYRYACELSGRTEERIKADAEIKRRRLDSVQADDFGELPLGR